MKILSLLTLIPSLCLGVVVTGPVRDVGDAAINSTMIFVPLDTPLQGTNGVVYIDWTKSSKITNGILTPVTLVGGRYDCILPSSKTFKGYAIPGDTNTYTLAQFATLATNVPTLNFVPLFQTNYYFSTNFVELTNVPTYVIPGQYMTFTTNATGTKITNAVDASTLSGSSYFQGAFAPLNSVVVLARGIATMTNGVAKIDSGVVLSLTQPIMIGYNDRTTGTNGFGTVAYFVSNAIPTQFFFVKSTSSRDTNRVAWAVLKP